MISSSEEETFQLAKKLAESTPLPAHILLYGDLGAGKTLFARGLAAGFGIDDIDEVSSPTFTLVNEYKGRIKIHHIDLYRLESNGLHGLGLDEIFDDPNSAVIVEWADRLGDYEVSGAIKVFLEYVDEHSRKINVLIRDRSP